jgi:iron complex outermembrane receptor protein
VPQYKGSLLARSSLSAIAVATGLFSAPQVQAQEVSEVVVTAQRRAVDIQEVPAAISVVGGEALERAGVTDVKNLQFQVPGLLVSQETALNTQVYIRGVGNNIGGIAASNSVSTFVDGAYVPNSLQAIQAFNDVERIEVLKGPQAVLYGRNATGGALNVISRAPSFTFGGNAEVSYGNYDAYSVRASVSGPLVEDELAARISVLSTHHRGYNINLADGGNPIDDEFVTGVRGALMARLGENVTATLRADYSRTRTADYLKATNLDGYTYALTPEARAQYVEHVRKVYNDVPGRALHKDRGVNLNLRYAAPFGDITSVSSFRGFKSGPNFSDLNSLSVANVINGVPNFTSRVGEEFASDSIYQEVYVATDATKRLNGILGANYFYEDASNYNRARAATFTANDRFGKTKAWAAYADFRFALTEQVTLGAGVRYSEEDRTYRQNVLNAATLQVTRTTSNAATYKKTTPRVGVEFRRTEGELWFVNYTTGFKSGGFNEGDPLDDFDPESIWAIEGGVKKEFGRSLIFNVSGFYYDYKDLQVSRFLPSINARQITNAGSAKLYGVDMELVWRVSEQLRVSGGLSLLHTKYGSIILCSDFEVACTITVNGVAQANPVGSIDYGGNELARAPKASGQLAVDYDVPVGAGELSLHAALTYRSKMNFGPFAFDVHEGPSYVLLNGEVRYSPTANWYVAVWGNNLTDKLVVVNVPTAGSLWRPNGTLLGTATRLVRPGPPRTYGVRLGVSF